MMRYLWTTLLAASAAFAVDIDVARAPCWIADADSAGSHVWLMCDRGEVWITPDAGAKWRKSVVPSPAKLRAIEMLDAENALIAGDGGVLLRTSDAGRSWQAIEVPTRENLRDIHVVNNTAWISGYGGVLLRSSDSGATWKSLPSGVNVALESIHFADEKLGCTVGWNGTILRTTDGGDTWTPVRDSDAMWTLRLVYLRDAKNGWAAGMLGQLLRTTDSGATWSEQETPVKSWFTSVLFDGPGRGWIAAEGDILVSENGGNAWQPLGIPGWHFFKQLIPVGDTVWAIGPFGAFRRHGDKDWRPVQTVLNIS